MSYFSPKQIDIKRYFFKNHPIILILEGAVRSGKTWLLLWLWFHHLWGMKNEEKDFIITGHTIGAIERNIIKPFNDIFGLNIKLDNKNRFKMLGNTCNCFGGDTYDAYKAMTGFTSYGWLGNEITLQHKNTIQEAFNRCSGEGFHIFWETNPDYPDHPIKVDYIDKSGECLANGRERIRSYHFEIDDNPYLTKEYVENLKATTPPGMWYDRKIKGLWVAAEGIVYEGFRRDFHVIEPFDIPPHWDRFRAIDFGYTNPFVCLWGALDEDGRLYIYCEYKQAQVLIKDHVKHIRSKTEKAKDPYGQEHELEYNTVSDHDAQDNAELRNLGVYTKNANKDVTLGIQKVAERLVKHNDGKPRLFIFNTCGETIKEFGKYAWAEKKEGKPIKEEPVKVDDHCMDALRYMVAEIDMGPRAVVPDIGAGALGL